MNWSLACTSLSIVSNRKCRSSQSNWAPTCKLPYKVLTIVQGEKSGQLLNLLSLISFENMGARVFVINSTFGKQDDSISPKCYKADSLTHTGWSLKGQDVDVGTDIDVGALNGSKWCISRRWSFRGSIFVFLSLSLFPHFHCRFTAACRKTMSAKQWNVQTVPFYDSTLLLRSILPTRATVWLFAKIHRNVGYFRLQWLLITSHVCPPPKHLSDLHNLWKQCGSPSYLIYLPSIPHLSLFSFTRTSFSLWFNFEFNTLVVQAAVFQKTVN